MDYSGNLIRKGGVFRTTICGVVELNKMSRDTQLEFRNRIRKRHTRESVRNDPERFLSSPCYALCFIGTRMDNPFSLKESLATSLSFFLFFGIELFSYRSWSTDGTQWSVSFTISNDSWLSWVLFCQNIVSFPNV